MTRAVAVISPCFLTECSEISSPHSHHPSFGNTHRKLVPSFMGCTLKLRASTSCFDLKLLSSESSSQPREKALMSRPLPRSVLCQAPRWNTRVGKIKKTEGFFPTYPFPFHRCSGIIWLSWYSNSLLAVLPTVTGIDGNLGHDTLERPESSKDEGVARGQRCMGGSGCTSVSKWRRTSWAILWGRFEISLRKWAFPFEIVRISRVSSPFPRGGRDYRKETKKRSKASRAHLSAGNAS